MKLYMVIKNNQNYKRLLMRERHQLTDAENVDIHRHLAINADIRSIRSRINIIQSNTYSSIRRNT